MAVNPTCEPYWPPETYVVVTINTSGEKHVWGAFNASADDQAGMPFDKQTAQQLADNINAQPPNVAHGWHAFALPLEWTMEPGD